MLPGCGTVVQKEGERAWEPNMSHLPKGGAIAMASFRGRSREKGDSNVRRQTFRDHLGAGQGTRWASQMAPTSFPVRCSQCAV